MIFVLMGDGDWAISDETSAVVVAAAVFSFISTRCFPFSLPSPASLASKPRCRRKDRGALASGGRRRWNEQPKEGGKTRRRTKGHSIIAAIFSFLFFLLPLFSSSFFNLTLLFWKNKTKQNQKNYFHQGEDILGFLDVRDVAHSLLDSLPADVVADAKLLRRMKALEDAGPGFAAKAISELPAGFGGDGSFLPASRSDKMTLLELIHDAFLFPKAPPMKSEGAKGEGEGDKKSGVSHRVGVRRF